MIFMPKQYPRELRERTVRLVAEHRDQYETEYAAIRSAGLRRHRPRGWPGGRGQDLSVMMTERAWSFRGDPAALSNRHDHHKHDGMFCAGP
jgi:hypothetical protein